MSELSLSYQKVRYDLRPAKQVERLMLIDALRRLSAGGFPIANYQYTGMGSVHFYDFSLFHRYVGINRMLSVEKSKAISRRVKFNRPFKLVDIKIGAIGAVIPNLARSRQHLLWLDYDSTVRPAYIADVAQAVSHLSPGSIVLITVDVEPPKGLRTSSDIREYYEAEFVDLLPPGLKPSRYTPKNLPTLNADLIWRAIQRGLAGFEGLEFQPLFNFLYQDGHKMLTVGGMIVDEDARKRLASCELADATYLRNSFKSRHYRIHVPVLTRKERLYLDSGMPSSARWKPRFFEMSATDLKAYRDIYRFAPQFAELIL